MLKGKNIYLRQIEESDVNLLLLWENDTENWRYSESEAPFSLHQLQHYVKNASHVRQNQQLRFIICLNENHQAIGTIDLDRKSTRLNSSHVRISYAVFCLKKKIKITLTQNQQNNN